jgi:peptidoglycan/LPS O-acetylase OafA/YrhL
MTYDADHEVNGVTPDDALANAVAKAERAHALGWRWVRIYLVVWAVASVALVLGLGMGSREVTIGLLIAWAGLAIGGGLWSRARGLVPRGSGRRISRAAGLWAASYGIVLAVGISLETDSLGFWLSAAVLTSIPLLIAAIIPAPLSAPQPADVS